MGKAYELMFLFKDSSESYTTVLMIMNVYYVSRLFFKNGIYLLITAITNQQYCTKSVYKYKMMPLYSEIEQSEMLRVYTYMFLIHGLTIFVYTVTEQLHNIQDSPCIMCAMFDIFANIAPCIIQTKGHHCMLIHCTYSFLNIMTCSVLALLCPN